MTKQTYGSPEVVAIVRRLFEQEKDTSILPDDDPRKAEVEALDLPDFFYNTVCEVLQDKPNITVSYVIRYLDAVGFGVK